MVFSLTPALPNWKVGIPFDPASPCNLPPGKTVLRNEWSSHNGLKRQPPFQMLQGHGPTCHFCCLSQVEARQKETEEELVPYSDYCWNSSKIGRSMKIYESFEIFGDFGACENHGWLDDIRKARSKMEVKNFQSKWMARSICESRSTWRSVYLSPYNFQQKSHVLSEFVLDTGTKNQIDLYFVAFVCCVYPFKREGNNF